jgi:nucleotide-binding universal stress UspA family protein
MSAIFRKILCPVDFSDNSMAALGQAAKLARKDDVLLYLMHVELVLMSNPAELADYVTLSTEPGKFRLEPLARKYLATVRHQLVVQFGWPAEVIEKVAQRVVCASERSVLSFDSRATIGALKNILCPVDFVPNSIAALNFGWRLAQKYRAAISLLHVVPVPLGPSVASVEPPTPEWEQDARAQLVKVSVENIGAKAKYKLVVQRGDPASAILEVEKGTAAGLSVMVTHGRTGLSHLVLGSMGQRTVRESTVRVLTVPGRQSVA